MLETDRKIINALQGGFPISDHPFADAAAEIGISRQGLFKKIRRYSILNPEVEAD